MEAVYKATPCSIKSGKILVVQISIRRCAKNIREQKKTFTRRASVLVIRGSFCSSCLQALRPGRRLSHCLRVVSLFRVIFSLGEVDGAASTTVSALQCA
jgi:hypothetical protein